MNLFGLFSEISWSWDSTQITDVSPSTDGEVYAPLWEYNRLTVSQQGKWNNDPTIYRVYKKGEFQMKLGGDILQTAYLWLEAFVYAGGYSFYNSN